MKGSLLSLLFHSLGAFLFLVSCNTEPGNRTPPVEVDFQNAQSRHSESVMHTSDDKLYVAVSAMISPRETFTYYEELIDYISRRLGKPIIFKQRKTYQEINNLLQNHQLDFAFICSGAYVEARERFPLKLLVVPVVNGKPLYRAYIIVHKNAPIHKLEQLRGRDFAFTDPLSNTGYFYGLYLIRKMHDNPEHFFSRTIFTYAHDYSIQAVARKIVDGASVDGLIYNYLKRKYPERVKNVRVIHKSPGFGMPPVVVPPNSDPDMVNRLRNVFLKMNEDSTGRKILSGLMVDRFIIGHDSLYNSIREMQETGIK